MVVYIMKRHRATLAVAYTTTFLGYLATQLYPLATGFAINGVITGDYSAVLWLILCHFVMVGLEVTAKMLDTRVFSAIHAEFASDAIARAHRQELNPTLIAGRATLLREYVTFLERDVPAALLSAISLAVALTALFWLDPVIGIACLVLLVPMVLINSRLARRSRALNQRLNDRLEREVGLFQAGRTGQIRKHFKVVAGWRVRLSDLEATSYGALEIFVIALFVVALWRIGSGDAVAAGTIYALFAYVWRFVISLDQIPQIVQQMAKLSDIGRRLRG